MKSFSLKIIVNNHKGEAVRWLVGSDLEGELHGSVLMLTLSRPRAANALNAGVRDAFCAALGSAASDKRWMPSCSPEMVIVFSAEVSI